MLGNPRTPQGSAAFQLSLSPPYNQDSSDTEDRHLLLMARTEDKQRFLCGHDERQWFVAAIPESAGATTVQEAKQALKPRAVREAEAQMGVKTRDLHKRRKKTKAGAKIYHQGEWIFLPRPDLDSEDIIRISFRTAHNIVTVK